MQMCSNSYCRVGVTCTVHSTIRTHSFQIQEAMFPHSHWRKPQVLALRLRGRDDQRLVCVFSVFVGANRPRELIWDGIRAGCSQIVGDGVSTAGNQMSQLIGYRKRRREGSTPQPA